MRLIHGDCLEEMDSIASGSVDMVMADPPYQTTACHWDSMIPLEPMWEQLKRVTKKNGAIVMNASQPFTTTLIASNMKMFKYEIIWLKNTPTGMAQSAYSPMKYHENILVFSTGRVCTFNKQMEKREGIGKACYKYAHYCGESNHVKMDKVKKHYDVDLVNPSSVVLFNTVPNRKNKVHPTQKPLALMEYLIKTYTNEGETVLDFAMGSGTTGLACMYSIRNFIGIEKDEKYFKIAEARIEDSTKQLKLAM